MSAELPSEMYCLKCKKSMGVKDVHLDDVKFSSRKAGKEMIRKAYRGVCSGCEKNVSRWAKNQKEEVPAPAPVPSEPVPIPPPQ